MNTSRKSSLEGHGSSESDNIVRNKTCWFYFKPSYILGCPCLSETDEQSSNCNFDNNLFNMRQVVKKLQNEISSWKHGDPVENQINNCYNMHFFSKHLHQLHLDYIIRGNRIKSWLIIALSVVSCIRFFTLILIEEEYAIYFGSVQNFLGNPGKVMYVTLGFLSLESFWIRTVFIVKENGINMAYLSTYMCPTLQVDPNSERSKKELQGKFFTGKVSIVIFLVLMLSWQVLTTITRISLEGSFIRSVVWLLWSVFNVFVSLIAMVDFIDVPLFWSIAIGTQMTRQETLLDETRRLRDCKNAFTARMIYLSIESKYEDLKIYMTRSNMVSGMFVFPLNLCSTFINGSLIYAAINLDQYPALMIITYCLAFMCVGQTMAIMVGSAVVMTITRQIHVVLCSIPHRLSHSYLTRNHRWNLDAMTKCLGGHRPPIVIWGMEGEVYNSQVLYENLASTILFVLQFMELAKGSFGTGAFNTIQ